MSDTHNLDKEPIAIVGIGCRFPGGADSPGRLWDLLLEGFDGISQTPADRWDLNRYYSSKRDRAGKVYTKKGGFLEDIRGFDPAFFGISPREAGFMDPQQRLLLEVTWEALEDAGLIPGHLRGSNTGVFIGLFVHDFENLHMQPSEYPHMGPHSATGMSTTLASNRISYIYDFRGPSLVIDTACSSSLIATHLACQSLLNNETDIALAGGVNILADPTMFMVLCRAGMLSPDGYCKSFDARANGYTRAEGAGIVVLKRLSKAIVDKDSIYAVIRGTASNQDGNTEGVTVPSEESQRVAMLDALARAGVEPRQVKYIEAHGTGTAVGDPTEARALGSVLSRGRDKGECCYLGSIKSNLGHLESSAGVAGLIKAALVLKHRKIPPNLHFETPNPAIPFEDLQLKVPTSVVDFPDAGSEPCFAGINSFGFGGSNAHAVLQEYLPEADAGAAVSGCGKDDASGCLLPLSGHTEEALRASAENFLKYFQTVGDAESLNDIGYNLSRRRGTPLLAACRFRPKSGSSFFSAGCLY